MRIAPSVGPMHGVQANANAAPAISGPPEPAREISASGRHSRFSLRHERRQQEQHAERDDHDAGDLVERPARVLQRRAEAGRGHAERDEHDREREAEDDRGQQHAAARALAASAARRR